MHLPEVRRKLGLLVSAAGNVLMGADHFSPWGKTACRLALDGGPCGPAPLCPRLFVETHSEELHLHALDLGSLRGGDGGQEPVRRIESAVCIVAGKRLLVRPAIPNLPQFTHQAPFGMAEGCLGRPHSKSPT